MQTIVAILTRSYGAPLRWGGALLAAGAIAMAARRSRALSRDGAIAATAVGTVVHARGGLPGSAALVAFFVTSSALSRYKQRDKSRRGILAQAKGGERDAWQVLANGGLAAAWLGLFGRRGFGAYLGALATAAADTWATEIGLLAGGRPRLITTLRPVQPGASGGVTLPGTLAALAGAATVATAWAATAALSGQSACPRRARSHVSLGATVTLVGLLSSLVDSLLGATVQASYWCDRCAASTETATHSRCGQPTRLTRGWPWMSNDAVNAVATATGSVIGGVLLAP